MADLIVSFSRALRDVPVMAGDDVRTETIAIGASSAAGTLTAEPREGIVSLLPGADCWVCIGSDPEAGEPGTGIENSWPLQSGIPREFAIERGMKVAVIERA